LGFLGYSASIYEENSAVFSPEGSHHKHFDQFGMFHASADCQLLPPDTTGESYDSSKYQIYLESQTTPGLTIWLIEEVDWSGRPCNNEDRLCLTCCNGGPNREDNTVYRPRWDAWLQVLDYVKTYPGGVAMTIGEVALASAGDNAPTVPNPDQADNNHDGIGDVIEGATLVATDMTLARNQVGMLSAKLTNGSGDPLAQQTVQFVFDGDGDGVGEVYPEITGADGVATVNVIPTRLVGPATMTVHWDGIVTTADGSAAITVMDGTRLSLADAVATRTSPATALAKLTDAEGSPIAAKTIDFYVLQSGRKGGYLLVGSALTGADGSASVEIPTKYVANIPRAIQAIFHGDTDYFTATANAVTYR
jgi:hypothetical protein